jgi:predicted NUDIX family phosphoesterase/dephospho-CoA kinase
MPQKFIDAAVQVLRVHRSQLKVQEIYQKALEGQYLKSYGKTPVNTMRARLSEHIRRYGENSKFIRVGPNQFALREWKKDQKFELTEYDKPFLKDRSKESVICIRQELVDLIGRFFGFSKNYEPFLRSVRDPDNLVECYRNDASKRKDLKQLVSYVLLKEKGGKYLSYVRGNYGQRESLLKDVLCIGFGGHVNAGDLGLFDSVEQSAYREVHEELKGLKISNLRYIGAINDDSSPLGLNHFAFVFEADLPVHFSDSSRAREMSINKVRLVSDGELWERFHELEFWSQLVVRVLCKKPRTYKPVYIKTKGKSHSNNPIIVVGEIGSGKTEVSNFLSKHFHLPLISTRKCVARLIREEDFGAKNRERFQEKAQKLVSTPEGVSTLTDEIVREIRRHSNEKCPVVDGIRNIETYALFKKKYPKATLIYVDVPRDTAFRLYARRREEKAVTIHDFREERQHEVEKEVTLFKTRADIYLFNGGTLSDLYSVVKEWWHEKEKV